MPKPFELPPPGLAMSDGTLRSWTANPPPKRLRGFTTGSPVDAGLRFNVEPTGSISFSHALRAKRADGSTKWREINLGRYPTEQSLAGARSWIQKLARANGKGLLEGDLAELAHQIDLARGKAAAPRATVVGKTFREVAEEWIQRRDTARRPWSQATRRYTLRNLKHDAYPSLGDLPILEVTQTACSDILLASASRSAVGAKKTRTTLRQVFAFAQERGYLTDENGVLRASPVAALTKETHNIEDEDECDRALTHEEIPIFWHALSAKRPAGGRNDHMDERSQIGLKLILLLGCRPGELLKAEVRELSGLDGPETLWTIPPEHQKLPKREWTRRGPNLVPLPPTAVRLFRRLLEIGNHSRHVFASNTKSGRMNDNSLYQAMSRTFGGAGARGRQAFCVLPGDPDPNSRNGRDVPTPHDLRRTLATRAPDLGIDDDVIDRCLNHTPGKVKRTYLRNVSAYLARKRAALTTWGAHVGGLVGEPEGKNAPRLLADPVAGWSAASATASRIANVAAQRAP